MTRHPRAPTVAAAVLLIAAGCFLQGAQAGRLEEEDRRERDQGQAPAYSPSERVADIVAPRVTAPLCSAVAFPGLPRHAAKQFGFPEVAPTTDAAATAAAASDDLSWTPPSFCRGKDCPEFAVLETRGDVELRRYKRAHWISTNVSNTKWDDAYQEGYNRLQKYVGGDNVNATKLPQTNPSFTLMYVSDAKAHTLQSTYTIEYFVPFELQETPPAPTAPELAVTPVEEQDVWVLSFGGFATEDVVISKGFEFIDNLTGDGKDVHREFIGLALYDQPARLVKRHNELWLWDKRKPSSASAKASAKAAQVTQASREAAAAAAARGRAAAEAAAAGIKRAFQAAWALATGRANK